MRKIYLVTDEKNEKVAFTTYNALLNFFPVEDALFLSDQFKGRGKPFEKSAFVKEEFIFEKYKIKIETIQVGEDAGKISIPYSWFNQHN